VLRRSQDRSETPAPTASGRQKTKYLKIIPRKTALQSLLVAAVTTVLIFDSKFVSRRLAQRTND
jgi:hypothetical protein